MPNLALTVDVVTDEVIRMLIEAQRILDPMRAGARMRVLLRERFLAQASESFEGEGADQPWEPLSEWRVEDRGGSTHPILDWTGGLRDDVEHFKGRVRVTTGGPRDRAGFSFWFPDHGEMSGQYWGLTAGQRTNPLGATPLSSRPRPVFRGDARQLADSIDAVREYFREHNFLVEVD